MLNTHLMIRADDRPLQEAPNAFDAVSVNVSNNPFLSRVINPLVFCVRIFNSPISGHFIGVDRFRVRSGVVVNKLVQRSLVSVRNNLEANLALSLDCSDCDSLVTLVAASHPANLSANVGFIYFYNSAQKFAVNLAHGCSDAMTEIPRGFVSNSKRALDLQRRHAFL